MHAARRVWCCCGADIWPVRRLYVCLLVVGMLSHNAFSQATTRACRASALACSGVCMAPRPHSSPRFVQISNANKLSTNHAHQQEQVCPPPPLNDGPWGTCVAIGAQGTVMFSSQGPCSACYRSVNENGGTAMQWNDGPVVATWYTPVTVACP